MAETPGLYDPDRVMREQLHLSWHPKESGRPWFEGSLPPWPQSLLVQSGYCPPDCRVQDYTDHWNQQEYWEQCSEPISAHKSEVN